MAKSEQEIIAAHVNTMQVMTGKKISVQVIDRDIEALNKASLLSISENLQKFFGANIQHGCKDEETLFRKRCFIYISHISGKSFSKIGKFLTADRTGIAYNLKQTKIRITQDADFASKINAALKYTAQNFNKSRTGSN